MGKKLNLIGKRFGRLLVISESNRRDDSVMWNCICDCGKKVVVSGTRMNIGHVQSCGCLRKEVSSKVATKVLMGKRFGKLVVVEYVGSDKSQKALWKCKCDCGNYKIVMSGLLVSGDTRSCGCLRSKVGGDANTRFYSCYCAMVYRCSDLNNVSYKNYGGRGIKCNWDSYSAFKDDMYESYLDHVERYGEKDTTIERIDVNGDYCKENCRWATQKEQSRNKRNTVYVYYKGKKYCLADLSRLLGITSYMIKKNMKDGEYIDNC